MKYELIISSLGAQEDRPGFNQLVTDKLIEKFELYGDPGVYINAEGEIVCYQAVVKES